MKIKFVENRVVRDGDGTVTESHRRGQVKEMSEASARHWLNRGVAVRFEGKKAAAAKKPKKATKAKKAVPESAPETAANPEG